MNPSESKLKLTCGGGRSSCGNKYNQYIQELERKIKIKDAYLKLMYCVAFDYDNCDNIKDLQDLLDEIMKYSDLAIDSDDTTPIYNITDEISENILGEKIIKGE